MCVCVCVCVQVVHEAVPVAIGASRDGGEQGVLVKNIREAERNLKVHTHTHTHTGTHTHTHTRARAHTSPRIYDHLRAVERLRRLAQHTHTHTHTQSTIPYKVPNGIRLAKPVWPLYAHISVCSKRHGRDLWG